MVHYGNYDFNYLSRDQIKKKTVVYPLCRLVCVLYVHAIKQLAFFHDTS